MLLTNQNNSWEFNIFEIMRMTYFSNIVSVVVLIDSASTNGTLRWSLCYTISYWECWDVWQFNFLLQTAEEQMIISCCFITVCVCVFVCVCVCVCELGVCSVGRWSSQLWSSWVWRTMTAAVAVATKAVGGDSRWEDVSPFNFSPSLSNYLQLEFQMS